MISKIRHQTCQISDFHTECYKGGGVRFTIWSQTSKAFYAVENREKLSNFTKNNNYWGSFLKFLYLIANWTSYPKPIKGALTIISKSPSELLIRHYQLLQWAAVGISRKLNNFLKVPYTP